MKLLIMSVLSGFFLLACAPAEFSTVPDGNEAQLSLLNGETVEIVGTDDLDQILDQPATNQDDMGLGGDSSSNTPTSNNDDDDGYMNPIRDRDGGYNSNRDRDNGRNVTVEEVRAYCRMIPMTTSQEFMDWVRRCMITRFVEVKNKYNKEDKKKYEYVKKDKKKKHMCRERIVVVTPDQLVEDEGAMAIIGCGHGKKDKKINVCHHPSGDYNKRKTLCVGAPALKAFIGMNSKRSQEQSKNYAGPCLEQEAE